MARRKKSQPIISGAPTEVAEEVGAIGAPDDVAISAPPSEPEAVPQKPTRVRVRNMHPTSRVNRIAPGAVGTVSRRTLELYPTLFEAVDEG